MTKNEIIRLILRYLIKHPDAADSLEGITEWWMTREIIEIRMEEVSTAISMLTQQGLVLEKRIGASTIIYCVNKEKLGEVKLYISDPISEK